MNKNLDENMIWKEQYSLIGKYVVDFEDIVHQIRFTLSCMFQLQGLKSWKISEIVFSQKQFTAEPLISCFESIANELLKSDVDAKQILMQISDFRKKFSDQISVRNDFLHGTYHFGENTIFVGDGAIGQDYFYVTKGSPTKNGARRKEVATKNEDIIRHLDELKILRDEFWLLRGKLINQICKIEGL